MYPNSCIIYSKASGKAGEYIYSSNYFCSFTFTCNREIFDEQYLYFHSSNVYFAHIFNSVPKRLFIFCIFFTEH